jgi:ArsR family transcriptional regulator
MSRQVEKIFQALGNKTRLDVVRLIFSEKEVSCQKLLEKFPLSQPTMSHHFRLLLDSGVLAARKDGVRHYYMVNTQKLNSLGIDLNKLKN